MTDHDPALVEKVATTLWSLECRAAEALHDEPLEVHNGFWRDARAVLDAVADDIARAERERVLAEVEDQKEAYLPSVALHGAWIAGWRAAVDHVAARLRTTPASVPSERMDS